MFRGEPYPNPFGKSRVDNPFQSHLDYPELNSGEYSKILSSISDIKKDPDLQSDSIVVSGSPGCGKTHLMMRMWRNVSSRHPFFYIRQPINHDLIYYHIYIKMLDSLSFEVPAKKISQILYFLSKAFSTIILKIFWQKNDLSPNDRDILESLIKDPLNLYVNIGTPDSGTGNANWKVVESVLLKWWEGEYGSLGFEYEIFKAFIKYAASEDEIKRRLIFRWLNGSSLSMEENDLIGIGHHHTEIDYEKFGFAGIKVISILSNIAGEPGVIIFDHLEGMDLNQRLFAKFFEYMKRLFEEIKGFLFVFSMVDEKWKRWRGMIDESALSRIETRLIPMEKPSRELKSKILELRSKEMGVPLGDFFTVEEIRTITDCETVRSMLSYASSCLGSKTYGLPMPEVPSSGEDRLLKEIKELRQELALLKKHLNVNLPSPREIFERKEVEEFLKAVRLSVLSEKNINPVFSEVEDAGKILFIAGVFMGKSVLETGKLKSGRMELPEHVLLKGKEKSVVIGFLNMNGLSLTTRLKNLSSICTNYSGIEFFLIRDEGESKISGKGARRLLDDLLNMPNFTFAEISYDARISFEVIYEMLLAIYGGDLDADPVSALSIASEKTGEHFLFKAFERAGINF